MATPAALGNEGIAKIRVQTSVGLPLIWQVNIMRHPTKFNNPSIFSIFVFWLAHSPHCYSLHRACSCPHWRARRRCASDTCIFTEGPSTLSSRRSLLALYYVPPSREYHYPSTIVLCSHTRVVQHEQRVRSGLGGALLLISTLSDYWVTNAPEAAVCVKIIKSPVCDNNLPNIWKVLQRRLCTRRATAQSDRDA